MGKLFGNMWSPATPHYGMTPLVNTEYPEVWKKLIMFISNPRHSLNSLEIPFSNYWFKLVCIEPRFTPSSDPCCVVSRYLYGGGDS
jgi:hypothetical protein